MIQYNLWEVSALAETMTLSVPDYDITLSPGDSIRIGRFSNVVWTVAYGWYGWGGNRPVCGWYLVNQLTQEIKPLQYTDLEDTYLIEKNGA